jgi:Tol biopolymer transport system component
LAPAAGASELVSVGPSGGSGDGMSSGVAVDEDGSVVVFFSDARLIVADTNGKRDVYLHDRGSGTIELVSVGNEEQVANGASQLAAGEPSVSADGDVVAFYSDASNLVGGDDNGERDVFVRQRSAGMTLRVSVGPGGVQGDGPSVHPSISADGSLVAFQSNASNLVANDSNGVSDIFVHNVATGSTERVCDDMVEANGFSLSPSISADGSVVVFVSAATNLVPEDNNNRLDVFACNLGTGDIELVSVDSDGLQGNGDSIVPDVNADGSIVVFKSTATNLVPEDFNRVVDVFARDRSNGTTERISVDVDGNDGGDSSFPPSISNDGRLVAFGSMAADLVDRDVNHAADVFVRDRQNDRTVLISLSADNEQANGSTPDVPPAISGDGREVAFVSLASNLDPDDGNGLADVFIGTAIRGGICIEDSDCPDGQSCENGRCVESTPTPVITSTPTITPTPIPTNTPTITPTFVPCEDDCDCEPDEVCRGGFCRERRLCDDDDPVLDRLNCFEREACIESECGCEAGVSCILCECGGDCNLDGFVLSNEISRAILVLAGARDLADCQAADIDGDGEVMGNEITLAVINLDEGCVQEGRPLLFAHDRSEMVTLSVRASESSNGTTTLSVDVSGGLDEVATVQLDVLFDPEQLSIGRPSEACQIDARLGGHALVASLPQSPPAPDGMQRLRLFVGDTNAPVETFADGPVAHCTLQVTDAAGDDISLAADRLNIGDERGNTFRTQVLTGDVVVVPPTPTPRAAPPAACTGDCDGDGEVLGNEITQVVRIMAGDLDLGECAAADADGDGEVFVTDVTRAVLNLGLGCPQ